MTTTTTTLSRGSPTRLAAFGRATRRLAVAYLPALCLIALLVTGWEAWVRVFDTRPYVLPAPSRIWTAFLEVRETLPNHIRTTVGEALLGLGIAAVVGVVLAAAIALIPLVRRVVYPLVVVTQSVPLAVLAPLLIVWFGFGTGPKVMVVALTGFFPIVVSTVDGLMHGDRDMADLARSMGARRLTVMRYVLIPAALPSFFAGLKIASAYAVFGAIVGEWVGAREGLGIFITRAQASYRADRVFVGVVIVALVSMLLFATVHLIARLATPWMYVQQQEEDSR